MACGDTYFYPVGDNPHLWVQISEFVDNGFGDRHAVFVNFTTSKGGRHAVCVTAEEASHMMISRDSDINYGDSLQIRESRLQAYINSGKAIPHDPLNPEVVKKIIDGGIMNQALSRGSRRMIGWDGRT